MDEGDLLVTLCDLRMVGPINLNEELNAHAVGVHRLNELHFSQLLKCQLLERADLRTPYFHHLRDRRHCYDICVLEYHPAISVNVLRVFFFSCDPGILSVLNLDTQLQADLTQSGKSV